MSAVSARVRRGTLAASLIGALAVAPAVAVVAGSAAIAATSEPSAAPSLQPSVTPSAVSADAKGSPLPVVTPSEAEAAAPESGEPVTSPEPVATPADAEPAEISPLDEEPAEPAEQAEPAEKPTTETTETTETSEPTETHEPAQRQALSQPQPRIVAMSASAPVAPLAGPGDQELNPTGNETIGADGCTYTFDVVGAASHITDIEDCTVVEVPESFAGFPVERIGRVAGDLSMTGREAFTSITLPDSLEVVSGSAFRDATSLTHLDLGEGVSEIGFNAFRDAENLTSVTLPDSMRTVGSRAFSGMDALRDLDLGSGLQVVEAFGFEGAGQVTDLTLPASLTNVKDTAFGHMTRLEFILVEGNVNALGKFVFIGSTGLEEVEFHSRSTTERVLGNILTDSAQPIVYFRDGAFGESCEPETISMGGIDVLPRCLFDVTFDSGLLALTEVTNVREGADLGSIAPEPFVPELHVFTGYVPSIFEPVAADTHYVAQFEARQAGDYTPNEDDLVDEAQGGFFVFGGPDIEAGTNITLVSESEPTGTSEPEPGTTEEPLPGGTLEPLPGGALGLTLSEDPPPLNEDPEPSDPNDVFDFWLFSTPVELEIVSFNSNTVVVHVPADTEPGAHKIALYSVFGDLFGWIPVNVIGADVPGAPTTPETETPDTETPDPDQPGGGGDTDVEPVDDSSATPVANPVTPVDGGATPSESATPTGDTAGENVSAEALAATGPSVAVPMAAALALAMLGGVLIVSRRLGR